MSKPTQTQAQPTSQPLVTPAPSGLLQRKCDCGKSAGLTGKCSDCESKKLTLQRRSNQQEENETPPVMHEMLRSDFPKIQPKLKISAPNDKYEQEADRIADQVMRMPEPSVAANSSALGEETLSIQRLEDSDDERDRSEENLQLKPLVGAESIQRQELEEDEDEEKDEEEEMLQTKRSSSQAPEVTPSIETGIQTLRRSGGQPLSPSLRTFMEPRFGQDLSGVRLHTTEPAAQLAENLNAQAFTLRNDIVFGAGKFQPETVVGRRLLAHELTHVIQQSRYNTADHLLRRKPLTNEERKRERLIEFLNLVKSRILRRVQRGQKILITKGRSEKAEQILSLNRSGDPEFGNIAADIKQILTQFVVLGKKLNKGQMSLHRLQIEAQTVEDEPTGIEEGTPPEFSLKGKPEASIAPELELMPDAFMLGPRFMDVDFALQAHFKAKGDVEVTGGTDEEVSKWEVGFLQTVISSKGTAKYIADRGNCFGLSREVPPNTRDREVGGTPPWYGSKSTKQFVSSESAVPVEMEDNPATGVNWEIREGDPLSSFVKGYGPLDVTCGGGQFGTWLVVRQKESGNIVYLYSWQWAVDYGGDFLAKRKEARSLAEQKPPIGGEGKGNLEPKLDGEVANKSVRVRFIPRSRCKPCDQM
jgi:hypothetical protein